MTTSPVLQVRLVAYTDPLVLPMLAELSHEYSTRYGEGHGLADLAAEQRRGAAEFGPPDGGVVVLVDMDGPVSGGYRRIHLTTGLRQPEAVGLYRAAGYVPQFDGSLPPERIGRDAFTYQGRAQPPRAGATARRLTRGPAGGRVDVR